jgi:hypothetical protein
MKPPWLNTGEDAIEEHRLLGGKLLLGPVFGFGTVGFEGDAKPTMSGIRHTMPSNRRKVVCEMKVPALI